MAMISCPECGKDVSDKAATCPNCGVAIKRGKLSSLLDIGKKHLPVIQEASQKYIKTIQETGKKHLDTLQKHIQENQESEKEQKTVIESQEPITLIVPQKDDSISNTVNPVVPPNQTDKPHDGIVGKATALYNKVINDKKLLVLTGVAVASILIIIIAISSSSGNKQNPATISNPTPQPIQSSPQTQNPTPEPTPQPTPEPQVIINEVQTGIVIEYDENLFLYNAY